MKKEKSKKMQSLDALFSSTTSLKNHVLIATTLIQDDIFKQSVIYICEHSAEGAIGLIINHPVQFSLQYVFEQMEIKVKAPAVNGLPLLLGGPMHQERGFVIHRKTKSPWRSSLKMTDELCITTSHDILESIADGAGPDEMLVILGYAGWDTHQLEKELAENAWLVCPMPKDYSLLFDVPFEERWQKAASLLGINMHYFSTDIGHA